MLKVLLVKARDMNVPNLLPPYRNLLLMLKNPPCFKLLLLSNLSNFKNVHERSTRCIHCDGLQVAENS